MAINDGKHIVNIMNRQPCKDHKAERGFPCYQIPSESSEALDVIGICNKRAFHGGANGKISQSSYQKEQRQQKKYQKAS